MDPRAFHALAQKLASDPAPAECRTAVSRAYYATFNVGAELCAAWVSASVRALRHAGRFTIA